MISIKNARQLDKMREAGALLHDILQQVKAFIAPGKTTAQVDAYAEKLIRSHGAVPSFLNYNGFPASLCTSIDGEVVHGIPGPTVLTEGMILSIDGGLILDGWQADSAFTVGIGQISEQARKLIEVTEQSFFKALEVARAGRHVSDIGHAVQAYVESFGFAPVRALCGHGIGREMHEEPEVPNYGSPGHGVRLRQGMAICIEPMIVTGGWPVEMLDDGWTVVTADGGLCAHYEHTLAITEGAPELLTLPGYKGERA